MRTAPGRKAVAVVTSLALAGVLVACGLPGGGEPPPTPEACEFADVEGVSHNDTLETAVELTIDDLSQVLHSCNHFGAAGDPDFFRLPLLEDSQEVSFNCTPSGAGQLIALNFWEDDGAGATAVVNGPCADDFGPEDQDNPGRTIWLEIRHSATGVEASGTFSLAS